MADEGPCNDRGLPLPQSASFRQLYSTLNPQEIRTLLLAPGTVNSPVKVQLKVVATTRSQQYEALSYVWGPTQADHRIECNNIAFQVTESLHTALSHLRYETSWRRLWVDQICIDQANDDELMDQVTRMGSIYASSSRAVVWLGRKDHAMSEAWTVIEENCRGVSLVRSDFLIPSPVSVKKRTRGPSHPRRSLDSNTDLPSDSDSFRTSVSSRSSRKSRKSDASIVRPLRPSPNSSTASLSSWSSGLSSTSSRHTHHSPRTPIRKRVSGSSERLGSPSITMIQAESDLRLSPSPKSVQHSRLKLALSVFQHLYFTRLWTFQEIVLSPAAIFVSDGIECALADLMGWYFHYVAKPTISRPGHTSSKSHTLHRDSMVYDSAGIFENIMHVRHQISKAQGSLHSFDSDSLPSSILSHGMNFSTLLMLTRQLQASKAEDRVLSLLGLHQGFANYLGRITETEGWLPVFELFQVAFRYCVEAEQNLDILSAAGIYSGNKTKGYEGWPSWLPDWTKGYPLRPMVLEHTKHGPRPTLTELNEEDLVEPTLSSDVLQASSSTRLFVHFDENEHGRCSLKVRGRRLGIVLTRPDSWPLQFFVAERQTYTAMEAKKSHPTQHSLGIEAILEASSPDIATLSYAGEVLKKARACAQICRPLRTFAAVESGDWVCMLSGGSLLYIVRPIAGCAARKSRDVGAKPSMHEASDTRLIDRDHSDQYRFVGECAITAHIDGLHTLSFDSCDAPTMVEFEFI